MSLYESAFVPIRPSRFKSGTCSSTARRRKGKILSLNFFSLFWNLFLSNRFKFRDRWELISRHGSMQVCSPLPRIRAPTELFRPFSKSKFKERFSEIDNMQKYYSNFFAFSLSCDWHFVSFLLFDFPEDIIGVVKLVFLRLSLHFFPCSLLQVTITDFITFFPSSFLVHFHLSGVEFFDEDERVEHIKLNLNINFHVSLLIEKKNVYNIARLIKDLKWRGKLFRRAFGLYEWGESEEAHLSHFIRHILIVWAVIE